MNTVKKRANDDAPNFGKNPATVLDMQKAGSELRQAREQAGLSAEQIAERTKIKLPRIIALEEGDFESLPQGIYLDGIVRAYAHEVKLDCEPIVELVRLERGKLPGDTPIAFQEPVEFERPLPAEKMPITHEVPVRAVRPQQGRLAFALVVLLAIAGWGAYLYEVSRASDRDTAGKISTLAPQVQPPIAPVAFSENAVSTDVARSEDVSGAWKLATHGSQTPVSVAGTIDGGRLTLNFTERGAQRSTQRKFDLLLDKPGTLRGGFTSTAARSSGTVVSQRLP